MCCRECCSPPVSQQCEATELYRITHVFVLEDVCPPVNKQIREPLIKTLHFHATISHQILHFNLPSPFVVRVKLGWHRLIKSN